MKKVLTMLAVLFTVTLVGCTSTSTSNWQPKVWSDNSDSHADRDKKDADRGAGYGRGQGTGGSGKGLGSKR